MKGAQLRGRSPHSPQCIFHWSCRCASGLRRKQVVPCLLQRQCLCAHSPVRHMLEHQTSRLTKYFVFSKSVPAHGSAGA